MMLMLVLLLLLLLQEDDAGVNGFVAVVAFVTFVTDGVIYSFDCLFESTKKYLLLLWSELIFCFLV
jgi:hypothetical protein